MRKNILSKTPDKLVIFF